MNYTETRTAREEIYNGKILHVTCDTVRLPNGESAPREVAWHRGAVAVIPITEAGEIVLVEQYRYAMGKLLLEIPAGKLEADDCDPLEAAKRELSEETGYTATEWIPFGEYYGSPAILSERIFLFLARGLTPGEMHPDDDEFLHVKKLPIEAVTREILSGNIPDGKTQAAVLRYVLQEGVGGGALNKIL